MTADPRRHRKAERERYAVRYSVAPGIGEEVQKDNGTPVQSQPEREAVLPQSVAGIEGSSVRPTAGVKLP